MTHNDSSPNTEANSKPYKVTCNIKQLSSTAEWMPIGVMDWHTGIQL